MASSSLLLCLLFLSAAAAAGGAVVNPRRSLAAQTAKSGDMASLAAGSPMVAGLMNERLKALTTSFAQQMGREFHYCIKNMYVINQPPLLALLASKSFNSLDGMRIILMHALLCFCLPKNKTTTMQGSRVEHGLQFLFRSRLPHNLHEGNQR